MNTAGVSLDAALTRARLQADTLVAIDELPALCAALWDRHDTTMAAVALLHLYEERWSYIDSAHMDTRERALLERLVRDVGNGGFLD